MKQSALCVQHLSGIFVFVKIKSSQTIQTSVNAFHSEWRQKCSSRRLVIFNRIPSWGQAVI